MKAHEELHVQWETGSCFPMDNPRGLWILWGLG